MKPGYKTSEFGVVAATITGLLVSAGFVGVSDAEELTKVIDAAFAFISTLVLAYAYMRNRNELKKKELETQTPTTNPFPVDPQAAQP